MQAAKFNMDPFTLAQKTHLVNGVMGYEAQLVNAFVSSSGAIDGRFSYEKFGPWENVIGKFDVKANAKGKKYMSPAWGFDDEKGCGVTIKAVLAETKKERTLELLLSQAQTRNSTLWASDPYQQLCYLAVKKWARLYTPDVLLGVYSEDELQDVKPERDITPPKNSALDSLLAEGQAEPQPVVEPEVVTEQQEQQEQQEQPKVSKEYEQLFDKLYECGTVDQLKAFGEANKAAIGKLAENEQSSLREHYNQLGQQIKDLEKL